MDKLKAGETIRFYHKGVGRPTKHNFDEYTVVKVFRNHVLCVDEYGHRVSFSKGELIENGILSNEDLNNDVVYERLLGGHNDSKANFRARLARYF